MDRWFRKRMKKEEGGWGTGPEAVRGTASRLSQCESVGAGQTALQGARCLSVSVYQKGMRGRKGEKAYSVKKTENV